jgi:hypothetical protein
LPSEDIVDIIVVDGFSEEFALREGRAISSVATAFILHGVRQLIGKMQCERKSTNLFVWPTSVAMTFGEASGPVGKL